MEEFLVLHGIVFFSLFLAFQIALTVWAWRRGCGAGLLFLVAFIPLIGVPFLLYRQRDTVEDNHIAGALVYLVLIPCLFFFLLWYPELMEDDIPWALLHTMQFFGFLGLVNLVAAPAMERAAHPRRPAPEGGEEATVRGEREGRGQAATAAAKPGDLFGFAPDSPALTGDEGTAQAVAGLVGGRAAAPEQKQRHWFLTAYLVLTIIGSPVLTALYLFKPSIWESVFPVPVPPWYFPALAVATVAALVFYIALFQWNKWGFWGICALAPAGFALALLAGLGPKIAFNNFLGPVLLYGVLQVGGEKKGWTQLE